MLLGFVGALLPVPFLLLFFSSVLKWLHKFPALNGLTQFIDNKNPEKMSTTLKNRPRQP